MQIKEDEGLTIKDIVDMSGKGKSVVGRILYNNCEGVNADVVEEVVNSLGYTLEVCLVAKNL